MRTCYLYRIVNMFNGKCYVGSTINLKDRFSNHRRELKGGIHFNRNLQNSFNKHGSAAFVYEILGECQEDQRDFQEAFYIQKFNACHPDFGYNALKIDLENGTKILSQDVKDRIAKKKMGVPRSLETRQKIGLAHKGQKRTAETCRRISEATLGRGCSEESREKNRESNTGRKRSTETRKNMSLAQRPPRTPHTEESKRKIREARKNQVIQSHTEESKKKIGDTNRARMTLEARKHLSDINKIRISKLKEGVI